MNPIPIQDLLAIATPFITILFLLAVGAGLRRKRVITPDGARQITGLVLNVTLPPLIWATLATEVTPQELGTAPLLAAMGVVGTAIGYALSAPIGRSPLFRPDQRATLATAIAITNTAFVGYPLCKALFGSKGLLYAVLYDVGLTVVMSTWSIWTLSKGNRRGGWQDLVRSPMVWSVILGMAWGALDWPTPDWLLQPLRTLGQATTPLALLTVGMLVQPAQPAQDTALPLARHRVRWQLAALSIARLLVAPALIWVVVWLLRVEPTAGAVIVLQTAMPSAVCTTAMVEQYGGDSAFAATGVVVTTVLSLLTLPVWSWVMIGH